MQTSFHNYNDPKFSDRSEQTEVAVWSESVLLAIPPASFGHIICSNHIVMPLSLKKLMGYIAFGFFVCHTFLCLL